MHMNMWFVQVVYDINMLICLILYNKLLHYYTVYLFRFHEIRHLWFWCLIFNRISSSWLHLIFFRYSDITSSHVGSFLFKHTLSSREMSKGWWVVNLAVRSDCCYYSTSTPGLWNMDLLPGYLKRRCQWKIPHESGDMTEGTIWMM